MPGEGGCGEEQKPRKSVQVDAGYFHPHQIRVRSQRLAQVVKELGRKHLGDDAEPHWLLQFSCPPLAAIRVPWDPVSRTALSSPAKGSQVYVLRSWVSLPEWLVGPAGSMPRSKEHGQGLGCSQFPGQSVLHSMSLGWRRQQPVGLGH